MFGSCEWPWLRTAAWTRHNHPSLTTTTTTPPLRRRSSVSVPLIVVAFVTSLLVPPKDALAAAGELYHGHNGATIFPGTTATFDDSKFIGQEEQQPWNKMVDGAAVSKVRRTPFNRFASIGRTSSSPPYAVLSSSATIH